MTEIHYATTKKLESLGSERLREEVRVVILCVNKGEWQIARSPPCTSNTIDTPPPRSRGLSVGGSDPPP